MSRFKKLEYLGFACAPRSLGRNHHHMHQILIFQCFQTIKFESFDLLTSFLLCKKVNITSRSGLSMKAIGSKSRSHASNTARPTSFVAKNPEDFARNKQGRLKGRFYIAVNDNGLNFVKGPMN